MQIEQVRELYEYNRWANERLWLAMTTLDEEQLKGDMHNGLGSILITLLHMVNGTRIWRLYWLGSSPTGSLLLDDFPTLQAIRARWQVENDELTRFLAHLQDTDLLRELHYVRSSQPEKTLRMPLWRSLVHVINHHTQHRSEIALHLTALNHSPGELGMNVFWEGGLA
jgi:uncharacterized damage-inducible protein DinB